MVICLPFVKTLNGFAEVGELVSDLADFFGCPCIIEVTLKSAQTRIASRIKGFIIEYKNWN